MNKRNILSYFPVGNDDQATEQRKHQQFASVIASGQNPRKKSDNILVQLNRRAAPGSAVVAGKSTTTSRPEKKVVVSLPREEKDESGPGRLPHPSLTPPAASASTCDRMVTSSSGTESDNLTPQATFPRIRSMATVYTDGACFNNGKRNSTGGIGVYFGEGDARNVSCKVTTEKKVTNQTMELLACCRAIETYFTSAIGASSSPPPKLRICTDSEYVVKSMNAWAQGWERAGWKTSSNKPVSNLAIMQRLLTLKRKHGVVFVHVPAHRSEPPVNAPNERHAHWLGNMRADELARNSISRSNTPRCPPALEKLLE